MVELPSGTHLAAISLPSYAPVNMYSFRTMRANSLAENLDPPICQTKFTGEPEVMLVATALRRAWLCQPPSLTQDLPDGDRQRTLDKDFTDFMRTTSRYKDNEWRAHCSIDPDKDDILSIWRLHIYEHFNHVFADTWRLLVESAMNMGEFMPPCHQPLEIKYPDVAGKALEEVFDNNVLMLPVYLDPGVKMRLVVDGYEDGGVFDGSSFDEIWWVLGCEGIKLYIKGNDLGTRKGAAAVMVLGVLGEARDEA